MRLLVVLALAACASRNPATPIPATPTVRPPPQPSVAQPTHSKEAQELLARCDAGDPWGCVQLGLAYQNGDGVPLDAPAAARYLHRGCDAKIPEACALLVHLYVAGGEGLARDPLTAAALRQGLCDDGHDSYCTEPVAEPEPDEPEPEP